MASGVGEGRQEGTGPPPAVALARSLGFTLRALVSYRRVLKEEVTTFATPPPPQPHHFTSLG